MPTVFTPKQDGDILYAADVNAVYQAINNLESAVNINVGTSQAQIPPSNLAGGIPASKLDPTSSGTLDSLTLTTLDTVNLTLAGEANLGSTGRLVVRNAQGIPILTLGEYDAVNHLHGLQAWDGQKATFRITEAGQVEIQGKVIADAPGSSFTGTINAQNGVFSGDVQVGGPNGILLRGSTGDIVAGTTGKIYGGGVTISSAGITITQGSLNIAGKAIISETGQATFTDASITGAVTATSGSIGGIAIDSTGIYTGDKGATSGFHIKAAGDVIFSSGTFRGTIQALSGSIEGTLSVSGALQAGQNQFSPSGIVIRYGDIDLGNGAFVVTPSGALTATSATITGTVYLAGGQVAQGGSFSVGSGVTLTDTGIEVSGSGGLRVTGAGGVEVTSGSVVVKTDAREVVRLGSWVDGATEHRGIRVQDATRTTFEVLETGQVTVRGTIYADSGEFTGHITAQSGELQNLTVTGTVDVTSGLIRAGTTTLSSAGISLTQGTINLAGRFIVDEQGRLTATEANLTGAITATSGSITGDLWVGDGVALSGATGQIIAGQTTLSSSGITIRQGTIQLGPHGEFTVDNAGALFATAATIRGHIDATSGSIQGTFMVGDGVTLSPSGITITGSQGIRVQGGSVAVRDAANTTDLVVLGHYTSPEGVSDTGLLITDGAQTVLQATQSGGLALRGVVTATGGSIAGDLSIGGRLLASGVVLDNASLQVLSPVYSAAIPGTGTYYQPEITLGHLQDPDGYGLRAGNVELSSAGLTSPGFKLLSTGEFEARSGKFGTTVHAIRLDSTGFYHGEAYGAVGSNFGINAMTGDAYFRGTVAVGQNSEMAGDMHILPGGRLYVGTDMGRRVEIVDSDTRTGLFAFDDQNQEKFAIALQTSGLEIRGALAVTGGTFLGNVTVGPSQEVRIVGAPSGGAESVPGLYLYEPDPSTRIVRLSYDGLSFSPDGGYTWRPAMTGGGVTANAITDGTLTITDTTGSADGIVVRRRVIDEPVTMPTDTSYVKLAHRAVTVVSVTNTAKTVAYQAGVDYVVNEPDGMIARTATSAIPGGDTVLVTYDWSAVEISSQKGITIREGALELTSGTGQTLISGGYLRVDGFDVGVVRSPNLVANGSFSLASSAFAWKRHNVAGEPVLGLPPAPQGHQVWTYDLTTYAVEATYPTGLQPYVVKYTPDGGQMWVTCIGENQVRVYDTATNSLLASIPVGMTPMAADMTPDGAYFLVAYSDIYDMVQPDKIAWIRTSDYTIEHTLAVGTKPLAVAIDPAGEYAYVSSSLRGGLNAWVEVTSYDFDVNQVFQVDLRARKVVNVVDVGRQPTALLVSPDGSRLYCMNAVEDTVDVIAIPSLTLIASVPVGDAPIMADLSPDGQYLYVANGGTDSITVIHTPTLTPIRTIHLGVEGILGVKVHPTTGLIFVSLGYVNKVLVLNPLTQSVEQELSTGDFPTYITISPDGQKLSVAMMGALAYVAFFYPEGPFIGDPWNETKHHGLRYTGAQGWVANRSDRTYDAGGNLTGAASVEFRLGESLQNRHGGYVALRVQGYTDQFAEIEQDVRTLENFSDGTGAPGSNFTPHVFSAEHLWSPGAPANQVLRVEVDELVPKYVRVDAHQTTPFVPGSRVTSTYNGLSYSFQTNQALGRSVSCTGTLQNGTAITDGSTDSGTYAYTTEQTPQAVIVDLGAVYLVRRIKVWHYYADGRRFAHKLEASADGTTWMTLFDSISDPNLRYPETPEGMTYDLPGTPIRFIRDTLAGSDVDGENRWVEIQAFADWFLDFAWRKPDGSPLARNASGAFARTAINGAYVEWSFTNEARADLYVTYLSGPDTGVIDIYLDDEFIQSFPNNPVPQLAYQLLPDILPGSHTIKICQQTGYIGLDTLRLEDYQLYQTTTMTVSPDPGERWTRIKIVPERAQSYVGEGLQSTYGAFDLPRLNRVTKQPDGSVAIRYRLRFRTELAAQPHTQVTGEGAVLPASGPFPLAHRPVIYGSERVYNPLDPTQVYTPGVDYLLDYRLGLLYRPPTSSVPPDGAVLVDYQYNTWADGTVYLTGVTGEQGRLATFWRPAEGIDKIPGFQIESYDPNTPWVPTGIQHHHLAPGSVTASKIHPHVIEDYHVSPHAKIAEYKLDLNYPTHPHPNKDVLDQITGFGSSGTSTDVARADHVHAYQELTSRPTRIWQVVELATAIAQNTGYTLPGGMTYTPGSYELAVYLDGRRLIPGHDYQETSPSQVTFLMDIPAGSHLMFDLIPLS